MSFFHSLSFSPTLPSSFLSFLTEIVADGSPSSPTFSLFFSLKDINSSHLGGIAGKAALAELPEEMRTRVDEVIFG